MEKSNDCKVEGCENKIHYSNFCWEHRDSCTYCYSSFIYDYRMCRTCLDKYMRRCSKCKVVYKLAEGQLPDLCNSCSCPYRNYF